MTSPQPPGIARIINQEGGVVGGGALLDGCLLVLTCAHVVNAALGLRPKAAEAPFGRAVQVDFPLQGTKKIPGKIVAWSPLGELGMGDIAVLRLDARPDGVVPMKLVTRMPAQVQHLRAFGYPQGQPTGIWKRDMAYAKARVIGQGVRIRTPRRGQYSPGADTPRFR